MPDISPPMTIWLAVDDVAPCDISRSPAQLAPASPNFFGSLIDATTV